MRARHFLSAFAIIVTLTAASGCATEPPPVSEKVQAYYDQNVSDSRSAPAYASTALVVADFEAAAAKLREAKEPFSLTVIGDSTSYAKQGWVEVSAREISERSGRAVSIQTWNIETNAYDPEQLIGQGEPLLTIWNGSAPGRDAEYSMKNLAALMPQKPDLLVFNHGHNVAEMESLRGLIYNAATTAGSQTAVAVMKQNPRVDEGAAAHVAKMELLPQMVADYPGVKLIDGFAAFGQDATSLLLEDGVHPNQFGYQKWADVFMQSLGI